MHVIGKAVASIESSDDAEFGPNGGFRAILTNESLDRDGDSLELGGWMPLQDSYPLDMDHEMNVAGTIGSYRPYIQDNEIWMDATFSSIPRAQEVRTLVKEGHIRSVSVAFMTDKTKKDGEPRREMLNAGIVAIPSNRDAIIQFAKSINIGELNIDTKDPKRPYGDVEYADPGYQSDGVHRYPINTPEHVRAAWSYINQGRDAQEYTPEQLGEIKGRIRSAAEKFGIKLDGKSSGIKLDVTPYLDTKAFAEQLTADLKAALSGGGGDSGALTQAIHDAAVHLGAVCIQMMPDPAPEGDSSGSGSSKTAENDSVDTKSQTLTLEGLPDELDLEKFKAALTETLGQVIKPVPDEVTPPTEESPAEPPAEAAADKAPADEAAGDAADEPEVDPQETAKITADEMLMGLFAASNS